MNRPRAAAVAMWTALAVLAAVVVFIGWRVAQNQAEENRENARRDARLSEVIRRLSDARGEREQLARLARSLRLNLRESNRRLRQAGEPPVPVPPAANEPERQDSELQDSELQEPEVQEAERQEREFQNPDVNDLERQEQEEQQDEAQDEERQDDEVQEAEEQEPEVQDEEIQDPEQQEAEEQEPEIQEPEEQDPERDDPDPDTPNPPASLTFNFGPPFGTFVCTRSGGTDADPTYTCEQAQ